MLLAKNMEMMAKILKVAPDKDLKEKNGKAPQNNQKFAHCGRWKHKGNSSKCGELKANKVFQPNGWISCKGKKEGMMVPRGAH